MMTALNASRLTQRTVFTVRPVILKTHLKNITWVTPEGGGGPNYLTCNSLRRFSCGSYPKM
ncbi:4Fe-4S dicluster domain-containing protein [Acinetobacter baumannii]